MLLPFANADGSPNASAMYVNAMLCSAIYHQDESPWKAFAAATGTTFQTLVYDRFSYEPDYAVIQGDGECLVIFDGTTNSAQWVGHGISAFFPLTDVQLKGILPVGPFVVGSFYLGENVVEPTITDLIAPSTRGIVRIAGHSYGAAAAFIFARHMGVSTINPSRIELMTFGQPRTYDGQTYGRFPDFYARIINKSSVSANRSVYGNVDPVTLCPFGFLSYGKVFDLIGSLRIFKPLKAVLALSWNHHGDPWVMEGGNLYLSDTWENNLGIIPTYDLLIFTANLMYGALHFMDQAYLPNARAAWIASGENGAAAAGRLSRRGVKQQGQLDLHIFDPAYSAYTRTPYVPPATLGPPVSTAILNQSFFDPSTPAVLPAEVADWSTISCQAFADTVGQTGSFGKLEGGGIGGVRTNWQYKGKDRLMIQEAINVLQAIAERDAKLLSRQVPAPMVQLSNNKQKETAGQNSFIFDPANTTLQVCLEQILIQLRFNLLVVPNGIPGPESN
jgi:hypothetical protein